MRPSEMAVHLPQGIEESKNRHWHSLALGLNKCLTMLGMDVEVLHVES